MPRKNQVKGYATQKLAGGRIGHYWRPSPKERAEGWSTITFRDAKQALLGCIEQNEMVLAARLGRAEGAGAARCGGGRAGPAIVRWKDARASYVADPAFTDLKPSSRAEYRSRLRTLETWAMDGDLRLTDLDARMVTDLRNVLVKDGRKHRTVALLRVLRIFLGYCQSQGWIASNPAKEFKIPEAPSRKRVLSWAEMERLASRAMRMGEPRMARTIRRAFWTFQREGDILALGRMNWRRIEPEGLSIKAQASLAGADGYVMGFRLQQAKTGAWVDIALPPPLRADVEADFALTREEERAGGWLYPDPGREGRVRHERPIPDYRFQRIFRRIADAEGIPDVQFRDLRRSGMVYFGELEVPLPFITAQSGHTVLGNKKTILDTYMPGNSRFAAEGMALAWQRHCARAAAEIAEADAQG